MPTISGNIEGATNGSGIAGSVDVQLCGYGSQVPRMNGVALVGRLTQNVVALGDGSFTFTVYGNDQISPVGTYYTVTVKDNNGDIAQVNAYRFLNNTSSYDLNVIDGYDPNQPTPPLPPLVTNLLLVVPWSAAPVFPGDTYTTFRITLAGDVTGATMPNTVQGNLYTFIIFQDTTGGHLFTWPTNISNATPVNPKPNGGTVQTFVRGLSSLVPIGPATWFN